MLIVVDGACDLSASTRRRSDVTVVPFHVSLERSPFIGSDEEFAEQLRDGAELKSAPPSDDLFSAAFGENREILVVATSKYLSSAADAATVGAKRSFSDVRTIDSRTFSAGSGLVVHALLKALAEGVGVGELGQLCEMTVEAVHTYAVVDKPSVLVGHGLLGRTRLSRFFRHPVLGIKDRARLLHQARSRKAALVWLVRHVREVFGTPPVAWAMAHAEARDVDDVVATFRDAFRREPVFVTTMNPTAAIHLGPGALVIAVQAT